MTLSYSWIFCLMWESLLFRYSQRSFFSRNVGSWRRDATPSRRLLTALFKSERNINNYQQLPVIRFSRSCKIHHKLHGKEHITSNFSRIFYELWQWKQQTGKRLTFFFLRYSWRIRLIRSTSYTQREKDAVKASVAGWSSEGMWRVEGKFTGRQEEQTQLGKCGTAEEQKECKKQESWVCVHDASSSGFTAQLEKL